MTDRDAWAYLVKRQRFTVERYADDGYAVALSSPGNPKSWHHGKSIAAAVEGARQAAEAMPLRGTR